MPSNEYSFDEASSPALDMEGRMPSAIVQQAEQRAKMGQVMKKLAYLRQGHDGPEVGTQYNLPTQGG